MREWIRDQDLFGQKIGLYYKGKPAYQTVSGGICSMLLIFAILSYTIVSIAHLSAYPKVT